MVPLRPSSKTLKQRAKKQAKACKVAGISTQAVPPTSLQLPDPPSRTPEAMDTGVSERPLSLESEGDSSRVSSGEEEVLLAGSSE